MKNISPFETLNILTRRLPTIPTFVAPRKWGNPTQWHYLMTTITFIVVIGGGVLGFKGLHVLYQRLPDLVKVIPRFDIDNQITQNPISLVSALVDGQIKVNKYQYIKGRTPDEAMKALQDIRHEIASHQIENTANARNEIQKAKATIYLHSGTFFYVEGPDSVKLLMIEAMDNNSIQTCSRPDEDCHHLIWQQADQTWAFTRAKKYIPIKDDDSNQITKSIQYILTEQQHIRNQQVREHFSFYQNQDQYEKAMVDLGQRSLMFFTEMIFFFVAWLAIFSMGLSAWKWDRDRNKGLLEPYVFVTQPIWLKFGSDLYQSIRFWMIFYGLLIIALWASNMPVTWPLIGVLGLVFPFVMLVTGLWGVFTVVLFHHQRGRRFAKLILSPVTFIVVWTIRLMIIWAGMQATQPQILFDRIQTFEQHPYGLLWAIPLALIMGAALYQLIMWRIGKRREGLRIARA